MLHSRQSLSSHAEDTSQPARGEARGSFSEAIAGSPRMQAQRAALDRLTTGVHSQSPSIAHDAPVQMVKMYNHGRKLYFNDEDNAPPPDHYRRADASEFNLASGEWSHDPEPSHYYVGSGDASRPLAHLSGLMNVGRHPSMNITTYEGDGTLRGLYPGSYEYNRWELEQRGASVKNNVDATNPLSMSPTRYDEVHFEFPHTGVYGSSVSPDKDQQATASNQALMAGSMEGLKHKIRPGGTLRISEGGFPFRPNTRGSPGFNLDEIASSSGYLLQEPEELGSVRVARTVGESVTLPRSVRHNYQYEPLRQQDPVRYVREESNRTMQEARRQLTTKLSYTMDWDEYTDTRTLESAMGEIQQSRDRLLAQCGIPANADRVLDLLHDFAAEVHEIVHRTSLY